MRVDLQVSLSQGSKGEKKLWSQKKPNLFWYWLSSNESFRETSLSMQSSQRVKGVRAKKETWHSLVITPDNVKSHVVVACHALFVVSCLPRDSFFSCFLRENFWPKLPDFSKSPPEPFQSLISHHDSRVDLSLSADFHVNQKSCCQLMNMRLLLLSFFLSSSILYSHSLFIIVILLHSLVSIHRRHIEVHGRPTPAVFRNKPHQNSKNSFRLVWTVDSYTRIEEYRLLYRQIKPFHPVSESALTGTYFLKKSFV